MVSNDDLENDWSKICLLAPKLEQNPFANYQKKERKKNRANQ